MHLVDQLLRLSATDLANHLGCVHLSRLSLALAEGRAQKPKWRDPVAELLAERGEAHERAYLAHLRDAEGLAVVQIAKDGGAAATAAAMGAGAAIIYQAQLGNERWFGRADFLRRVDSPSDLGAWSYEVTDAKLATETRAGTVLQLCVYSELLAEIQGTPPRQAWVVAPHHDFQAEPYRIADYAAYYRLVKQRLEAALADRAARTYPDPVPQCAVCSWWARCDAERRGDDHLCFVAGLSRLQIKELRRIDVRTLEQLGDLKNVPKPARGSREALVRARDQAEIQLRARRLGKPQHEILEPMGPEHGLALLPAPSSHDIFLDLEGDRLAPDGGREYLFGLLAADEAARRGAAAPPRVYLPVWATTPDEEKRSFELVVDLILATFREHPGMHVYHYGAYEPSTFKRLSGRYATRETELDTILRAELFVDLYTIVRHSLKASVESYSIKDLEQFFGLERKQDLRAATASRHAIEWAIEMREDLGLGARVAGATQLELGLDSAAAPPNPLTAHVEAVELYNREDCVSAEELRDWLETLRAGAERALDLVLPRPELKSGAAAEQIAATAVETERVRNELTRDVPEDPDERTPEQHARWLMGHLLEWHRREDKAAWWEYFRLRDLPPDDYEEERSALAGLTFVGTVGGTPRVPVNRYSFPPQDHDIRRKDAACVPPEGDEIGEIVAVDVGGHTIDIQHKGNRASERPERIFVKRQVPSGTKPAVLLEIGRWIAAHGVDAPGEHRAARDLLLRKPPRFLAGARGLAAPLVTMGGAASAARRERGADEPARGAQVIMFGAARSAREQRLAAAVGVAPGKVDPEVAEARRLGFELEHGVLPIQGPPGTGKTFTGSHMIVELLKAGKKVGVTAVSHEVIRNLLKDACKRAAEQQLPDFKCLHKGDERDGDPEELHSVDDNARVARLFVHGEYSLLGGTSWLWARPEFRSSVDVLFIDEAGQMSLADVLAVSAGADSLVLLGDPQQLEQPQQASHPPGTQASALEHLLDGAQTIPAERGLFLRETRRLHPQICKFTAEAFYEDRLTSAPGLESQAVLAPPGSPAARLGEAGLLYVPVAHEDNQARALEEVDAIAALVAELTRGDVVWRDAQRHEAPLDRADVMVVAPYNAQVTALTEKLPGVRVGTVDKFQGQQAPVVIVSLTTSSPDDAPRGMEFLYSGNRLNVATSRAKALCILVGSPRLFEPDCRTPQQMRLANAFCRYRELARTVQPSLVQPTPAPQT
ncbi:MAG TPA: TM0106 family RecB-like putative nuclease [Gammaproteobacteria bacterium]|nr:TM0106 family RecB-like putative nuclease [Gammaproteobacteria bacterium]